MNTHTTHKLRQFFSSRSLLFFLLLAVLCLGALVRSYKLTTVPAGFYSDEASIGVDAYMVLTTGKDSYDVPFPIFFQSTGDFKAPVAIYSTVPLIALFGYSEASVRLTSVLYGIATLIVLYLLGKELHSRTLGVWTAAIGATMPWLIHYDRVAFLMNVYVTWYILSVFLFLKATKDKRFLLIAMLSFGITLYTYQPPKLIVPLTIVGLLLIYRKYLLTHRKELLVSLLAFVLLAVPLAASMINGSGLARFNQVSIFSKDLPLTTVISQAASQYLTQFNPDYLIINGEKTFNLRHFTDGFTPLLPITLIFLVGGIFTCLLHIRKQSSQILLLLLLIYPVAAAIVIDPPFSSRAIIGAPLFAVLIGLGITTYVAFLQETFQKRFVTTTAACLIAGLLFLNFAGFVRFYFTTYPKYSSGYWGWQYGYGQAMESLKHQESMYDELIITHRFNAGEWMIRFYNEQYRCNKCKILSNPIDISDTKRQLFALRAEDIIDARGVSPLYQFTPIETISDPGGSKEIYIGTFTKLAAVR
jgi:4-amino-4-deoxy-L-arabinose transferase-like glycosyltransferase